MSKATELSLPLPARVQRVFLQGMGRVPRALFAPAAARCPINADGDRLAPEMALISLAADKIPGMALAEGPVEEARRNTRINGQMLAAPMPPLAVVEDLVAPGPAGDIPMTRYRAGTSSRGIVLFFHGGGFVVGDRISHDGVARTLAVETGADVVSVDYRLAPEHPFPAAYDDCLAAWRFVVGQAPVWGVSPKRIVVAGDSAGGNLAAVISQTVRGEDVVPCLQLLMYPVTDVRIGHERASRSEFATGRYLTQERIQWFMDQYIPSDDLLDDPRVSPMAATDLSGLPPAYVSVAGFDPLRDEGIDYAEALRAAGVPVTLDRVGSAIHAFANMTLISPDASAAVSRMSAAVVRALA